MLGHESRRNGSIDWRDMRRRAKGFLARLSLDIDPGSSLSTHSLAVQQLVAICRAMVVDAKVLILDEPTSSLDAYEVQQLFAIMRSLRDEGVAILFVSHFIEQVYEVSDRITILRNGLLVGEHLTPELPRLELVSKMIGKSLEALEAVEGSISDLTVGENIVLGVQADRGWARRIPRRKADEIVRKYIKALDIRPTNPETRVGNLSGGNQQKVLLARWLATAPRLLILDEPTRGIDVGAKAEVQHLVAQLATDGMSVVFISAELEEVLRLSHRIVIMRDRRKVAEIRNDETVDLDDVVELIASGGQA